VEFTKTQAKNYVISCNLYRRHLTREQKHEILVRLVAEKESVGLTQKEIARTAGVSRPTVARETAKQNVRNLYQKGVV
jgi:DNA invertase Pin-like site-specific DNA recombinase